MPPVFALGDKPDVFERLADPDVRLAIWTRPNPCRLEGFPAYAQPAHEELGCLPDWLGEDIGLLGDLYRGIAGTDWRVRLETAVERTCPAFHEDAVRLRLLVTYRGPGTEWAPEGLEGTIAQVPTGAVAAFKGRAWPSLQRVLHRSAKATARQPRWLLALDAETG
ncbi:MAG: DUF1826 domain-containing protein [Brevundimonas sp.]|uniref:DUF1826 domain-containing protein n=1 Tax=Brevundimonas sp. TaxID=1871086 RepID=UPI0027367651|nr:DUF1826 domain-containing protein [Brevundimonas sp.]MDP3379391.1 DUF1826 domain-containing protein [Brevundimonas sp.]